MLRCELCAPGALLQKPPSSMPTVGTRRGLLVTGGGRLETDGGTCELCKHAICRPGLSANGGSILKETVRSRVGTSQRAQYLTYIRCYSETHHARNRQHLVLSWAEVALLGDAKEGTGYLLIGVATTGVEVPCNRGARPTCVRPAATNSPPQPPRISLPTPTSLVIQISFQLDPIKLGSPTS